MKFEGGGTGASGPVSVGPQPQRIGAPMTVEDVPIMQLDLFSTGALPEDEGGDSGKRAPGLDEQPFPGDVPQFRLVHVANGRAMIQDDAGLWVVQAVRCCRIPAASPASRSATENGCSSPRRTGSSS